MPTAAPTEETYHIANYVFQDHQVWVHNTLVAASSFIKEDDKIPRIQPIPHARLQQLDVLRAPVILICYDQDQDMAEHWVQTVLGLSTTNITHRQPRKYIIP